MQIKLISKLIEIQKTNTKHETLSINKNQKFLENMHSTQVLAFYTRTQTHTAMQ